MKTCTWCGEAKEIEAFPYFGKKNRKRRTYCKSCDKEASRKNHMLRMGHTDETFAKQLEMQGGACAACGAPNGADGHRLCIDHDHDCCPTPRKSCGRCVRGLLCRRCNAALGLLSDSVDSITSLLVYRLQYEAKKVNA